MKTSNRKTRRLFAFLSIAFAALIISLPVLGNNHFTNDVKIRKDDSSHLSRRKLVKHKFTTRYYARLSSPGLHRSRSIGSKNSMKKAGAAKSYHIFHHSHRSHSKSPASQTAEKLFALLGNAVQMQDLHFRLNALTPATPDWKAGIDSVLEPYINGTEAYDSILVVGYTDNTGSKKTNLSLSAKRAAGIVAYLVQQGIPGHRIYIIAMGEEAPVSSNNSIEGRNLNRRVEINFLKSS